MSPKPSWHPGKLRQREVTAVKRDTRVQTQDPQVVCRW